MDFISNKSLNNGTFSRYKRFLTPYGTKDMKIKNFPLRNREKNRLSHMTSSLPLFNWQKIRSQKQAPLVWHVKMNFISNKSLNNGKFSRFKRFLTSYRTKDMKIKNFPLRNCPKNRLSHMTCGLPLTQDTIRSQLSSSYLACQNEYHFKWELKQRNIFPFQALSYAL